MPTGTSDVPATAPEPRPAVRWGFLLALVLLVAFGFWPHRAGRSLIPADGPADEFSAARAHDTVREIARAPHPTGTAEHDRVRAFLVGALRDFGLAVEVQETLSIDERSAVVRAVRVRNIVARWTPPPLDPNGDGSVDGLVDGLGDGRPKDAILLAAHYDTKPVSPGAADDGSGVAIILEVLRALVEGSGPTPEREVLVLLSDAEELHLFGARAFVAEHPLAASVGVVVNLEARGRTGASRMFQTTEGNAAWIDRLDRATGPIVSDSLSESLYRLLPRDTDLTALRELGVGGYNFAFIRDVVHYHTPLDRPEFLDLRSVQQQGAHVLALVRELGRGPLPGGWTGDAPADGAEGAAEDAVYFPFGPDLVVLAPVTSRVLSGLAVLLALAALVHAVRRERVRVSVLARVAFGCVLLLAFVTLGEVVAARLVEQGISGEEARPTRIEARGGRVLLALVLAGVPFLVHGLRSSRRSGARIAEIVGTMVLGWIGLVAASEAFLPHAAYLASLPLLGGAVALVSAGGREPTRPRTARAGLPLLAGAAPFLVLWPPVLDGIGVAFGPFAAPAVLLILALGAPFLLPALRVATPAPLRRRAGWCSLIAALAVSAFAASTLEPDAEHPRASSIYYAYDADAEAAVWGSTDPSPRGWVQQFLGDRPLRERSELEEARGSAWTKSAASVRLHAPRVRVEGDFTGPRVVEIELPEGIARLDIVPESLMRKLSIRDPAGEWRSVPSFRRLQIHAPEKTVALYVDADAPPLEFRLITLRYDLPEVPGWTPEPRGEDEVASEAPRTYVTITFEE